MLRIVGRLKILFTEEQLIAPSVCPSLALLMLPPTMPYYQAEGNTREGEGRGGGGYCSNARDCGWLFSLREYLAVFGASNIFGLSCFDAFFCSGWTLSDGRHDHDHNDICRAHNMHVVSTKVAIDCPVCPFFLTLTLLLPPRTKPERKSFSGRKEENKAEIDSIHRVIGAWLIYRITKAQCSIYILPVGTVDYNLFFTSMAMDCRVYPSLPRTPSHQAERHTPSGRIQSRDRQKKRLTSSEYGWII